MQLGEMTAGGDSGVRRSLQEASNCATIDITGDIYPGTYEEVALNGLRADYQSISDVSTSSSSGYTGSGTIVLYFDSSQRRRLTEQGEKDGIQGVEDDLDQLEECSTGNWVLEPYSGAYPIYTVADCAGHPADITNTVWMEYACLGCSAQPVTATVDIECAEGSEIGLGGTGATPAPVTLPTLPPIVELLVPETIAPATPEEMDESSCDVVEVLNSNFDGDYTSTGEETSGGRFVFERAEGGALIFVSFPVSTSTISSEEFHVNWHFDNRRLQDEMTLMADQKFPNQQRELETCYTGSWYLVGTTDADPVMLTLDCATHPADISSVWIEQPDSTEAYRGVYPNVIIRCQGTDDDSSGAETAMGAANTVSNARQNSKDGLMMTDPDHVLEGTSSSATAQGGDKDGNDDMENNVYDNNMAAIAAVIVVAVMLVLGLLALCFFQRRGRNKHHALRNNGHEAAVGRAASGGGNAVSAHSAAVA